jgi:hypothetical protein
MRQNGHGAITIEDVRTWIEETGLCVFLPRPTQAGQSNQSVLTAPTATPTFVEAVAGQRTTEPTLELIAAAESLLVRLESEGVAVRLNLAGQPGDQPDYVVAGWVLPYIYALRGDRDWRRSPQLTGSRQVSQLAVLAAKQLDSANLTAAQIRDALGREVTETAVLRALHELWKQLRIIPVVPEVGAPALWQPLRQRFQKAIAEGASTSQVTAISVLASIYLQAVIAASMEDVEMFLSPLTSRSKIREVVRGLAATRQVHSTSMGHSPMYYVAGTLPEFPAVPSYQATPSIPAYRGSAYLASYLGQDQDHDDDLYDAPVAGAPAPSASSAEPITAPYAHPKPAPLQPPVAQPAVSSAAHAQANTPPRPRPAAAHAAKPAGSGKSSSPRPRSGGDRRRAPMPRSAGSSAIGARSSAGPARPSRNGGASKLNGSHAAKPAHANGNGHARNGNGSHVSNGNNRRAAGSSANGSNGSNGLIGSKSGHSGWATRPASNGNGAKSTNGSRPTSRLGQGTETRTGSRPANGKVTAAGAKARPVSGYKATAKPAARSAKSSAVSRPGARPAVAKRTASESASRTPAASAAKRYSFSGQAKQAPKPVAKRSSGRAASPATKSSAGSGSKSHAKTAHPAGSKRRG